MPGPTESVRALAMALVVWLCLSSGSSWTGVAHADEPAERATVEANKNVSIEYTLTFDDGTEVENNIGETPLTFKHGTGMVIPGLDQALVGMKVGERKTVTIDPKEGYGLIDLASFLEVPLLSLPEDSQHVGAQVMAHDPELGEKLFRVDRIDKDKAVLDGNHPLAGKTLTFKIKVLAVE